MRTNSAYTYRVASADSNRVLVSSIYVCHIGEVGQHLRPVGEWQRLVIVESILLMHKQYSQLGALL